MLAGSFAPPLEIGVLWSTCPPPFKGVSQYAHLSPMARRSRETSVWSYPSPLAAMILWRLSSFLSWTPSLFSSLYPLTCARIQVRHCVRKLPFGVLPKNSRVIGLTSPQSLQHCPCIPWPCDANVWFQQRPACGPEQKGWGYQNSTLKTLPLLSFATPEPFAVPLPV